MSVTQNALRPNEVLSGGRVSGDIPRAHLQWVREYHGTNAESDVIASLPENARREMHDLTSAVPATWCSFHALVRLDRILQARFSRPHGGFLRELGRYTAYVVVKPDLLGEVHAYLRRLPVSSQLTQDFGSVSCRAASRSSAIIERRSDSCFSSTWCEHALGYYAQVVTMHGGADPIVLESSCQCAGDPSCTLELSWQ